MSGYLNFKIASDLHENCVFYPFGRISLSAGRVKKILGSHALPCALQLD